MKKYLYNNVYPFDKRFCFAAAKYCDLTKQSRVAADRIFLSAIIIFKNYRALNMHKNKKRCRAHQNSLDIEFIKIKIYATC